ncbi:MAG: siderophore biosynthesis protein, partial [Bacteroidota bacterium]
MPLILGRNRPNGAIGVWQITEDETALSTLASAVEEDEKVVRTFKNESRRKQWYACRALLRQMLSFDEVKVDYDMHGRPSLRGFKGDISFSHTQDYAAVILNKVGRAGIDIEKINPR